MKKEYKSYWHVSPSLETEFSYNIIGILYTDYHFIDINVILRARDKREYLMIFFFLFLTETICCDPSSEPSRRDGSDEESQHMCLSRINKNITKYSLLSRSLIIIGNSVVQDSFIYGR